MLKKFDETQAESFLKGLKVLTGIPYKKLEKYANENSIFNILEHPNTIEPNQQQLEKISLLNEFIASYRLLKMQEEENKITLNASSRAGEYFSSILGGTKDKEKFLVAFLDNGNNVIETRTVSEGSLGEAVVYPRNILKAALDCDCKSMVLAHNHPGGSLKASQQDMDVTERIVSIFKPLDINVLDHIIVAGTKYYSMAEQGHMPSASATKANYQPIALGKEDAVKESSTEYANEAINEEEDEWEM
jgi:DNA repair protein RadC